MIKTELIPVIHMVNHNQVVTNVKTCIECGINKIFLINHVVPIEDLIKCALFIKKEYNIWVGINMLGQTTEMSLLLDIDLDAIWCDAEVKDVNFSRNFKGVFFGGLAFKYQPKPLDLKKSCEWSVLSTDVSTTSGPATGKEASIDKILMIREYIGEHPLAIASGVSIDNIKKYKGIVNYLLVASSITSFGEIIRKDSLINLKNELENG